MGNAAVVARVRSVARVRELLQQHPSLYDAATAMPGALPVSGRGTAYVIRPEADAWLVRHYYRGGAIAQILHDKYIALGDRARYELHISTYARQAGIPTPEVVATATYRGGWFARFDIAFVYIENARDLAAVLFEGSPTDDDLQKASAVIRTMIERGLVHADLNLKNILVAPDRAYVIDLDRCRLVQRMNRGEAKRMRARFMRSLEKWQARTGMTVDAAHRRMLEDAFGG